MLRPLIRPIVRPLVRGVTEPGYGSLRLMPMDHYRADTAASALIIDTYDGGDELVHPSVWDAHRDYGADWNGYRYWMVATPYAGDNLEIENPCIYASADLETWVVPVGLTNPIEAKPVGGFNSDPHLVWGRDGYLYCIWRALETVEPKEKTYYLRSSDGVTWGGKTKMREANSLASSFVSPAVDWDGTQWVMYGVETVGSPNTVVRLTASDLAGPWSAAASCTVPVESGLDRWHIDTKLVNGKWLLLLQAPPIDTNVGGGLYLCESTDGMTFTLPSIPVIPRAGAWHTNVYRSCFVPKNVGGRYAFDLIYTGVATGPTWHLGKTEILPFDKAAYDAEPAAAIAGAAAGTPPYLLGDDFARADGAIGTSTGGEVWSASTGAFLVASGHAVASAASNTRAYLEAGSADVYAEWAITNSTGEAWAVARLSDANNYWRVGVTATGFSAQKIVAGAVTVISTLGGLTPGKDGLPGTVRLGVRMNGAAFVVLYDGMIVLRFTDAFNQSATKFGLQTQNTSTTFDNFFVRSLVGGL